MRGTTRTRAARPILLPGRKRTPGGCTTSTETCGSGCADSYEDWYYKESPMDDPTGAATGSDRVLRGGCWDGPTWLCRSAGRGKGAPGVGNRVLGLRVSLVPADAELGSAAAAGPSLDRFVDYPVKSYVFRDVSEYQPILGTSFVLSANVAIEQFGKEATPPVGKGRRKVPLTQRFLTRGLARVRTETEPVVRGIFIRRLL